MTPKVFISSFISVRVFFSDSTSLLNSTFTSWVVFIISHNYCAFTIVIKAFIQIFFKVLERILNYDVEALVLCFSSIAFPRACCNRVSGLWRRCIVLALLVKVLYWVLGIWSYV